MQIGNNLPLFYTQMPQSAPVQSAAIPPSTSLSAPSILDQPASQGVLVSISAEAQAAYARDNALYGKGEKAGTANGVAGIDQAGELEGCQTCKNRKYVDVSNDSSVSFQTPTHLGPAQAASSVMSHEMEHVSHEQARAEQNDRRVISQTVTLEMSSCPECGRMYVSGGLTRTITAGNSKANSGAEIEQKGADA